jgi:NADH-quinone oxidoreductase subunit J
MVELLVFVVSAVAILGGALGVILARNPVHSALSLVGSFFGIAVLFVDLDAHFLAAVQVIVYGGAIVVPFLFVIMLLGVDQSEDLRTDPIAGQRPLAAIAGVGILGAAIATIIVTDNSLDTVVTGQLGVTGALSGAGENIEKLGRAIFTDYLFAFEITSVLLVIAVIAAVVLARQPRSITAGDLEGDD